MNNKLNILYLPPTQVSSHSATQQYSFVTVVFVNGVEADRWYSRQGKTQSALKWRILKNASTVSHWEKLLGCEAEHVEYEPPTVESAFAAGYEAGLSDGYGSPHPGEQPTMEEALAAFRAETSVEAVGAK